MNELSQAQITKIQSKLDYFIQLGYEIDYHQSNKYVLDNGKLRIEWKYTLHYLSDKITDNFCLFNVNKREDGYHPLAYNVKSFKEFQKHFENN